MWHSMDLNLGTTVIFLPMVDKDQYARGLILSYFSPIAICIF